MEMLKFLMITTFYPPHHIGGDAVHVKYLAEELAKRGYEVHILYSLDAYKAKKVKRDVNEHARPLENVHIHVIETPLNLTTYTAYLTGVSSYITKRFETLVREIRPEIVHHHNISLLGFKILEKRDRYLNLYTAHDYWLICQQNSLLKYQKTICKGPSFLSCSLCALTTGRPPQLWRHTKAYKNVIGDIDVIIAPSTYLRNRIVEVINTNARIAVMPNFALYPPSRIPSSEFENFYLYVGVLEPHKGVMELVRTFKKIVHKIDEKLIIVGEGSLRSKIQEYVNKHNLKNRILLLGYINRNKLYSLLRDAMAIIIPSIWPENCPLIALEALSVGTPIIVSNYGGLPEIAQKIDERLIFNTFEELASIIVDFNRDEYPSSRIEKIYKTFYSPEAYLTRYLDIISKTMALEA